MIPRSSEAPLALAQRRCTMPGCKYFDSQGRSPSLCDAHYNFMLGQQVAGPAAPGWRISRRYKRSNGNGLGGAP